MSWELDLVESDIKELKSLTIGVSRGLRDLQQRSTPRGKAKPERRPGDVLLRNAVSELFRPPTHSFGGRITYEKTAGDMARQLYGGDHDLHDWIERAATSPANTTTPGYAAELVPTSVIDFLTGDAPAGFAQLAAQCLNVPMQASVKIPSRVYPFALAGSWTGEGQAKPVYTVPLTSVTLAPSKLTCITAWSEEILSCSTPSVEALVRDALLHDINGLLDTTAFGTTAASAVQPAGLFNGATAVTATASGTPAEKMAADLAALAAAVSANAPSAKVIYIMNPAQSLRLTLLAPGFSGVVASGFMTASSVGAVDASSVVTMLGDLQFLASSNATIHMSDTPAPISATGSPNTIAAPVSSAFQMDLIALRSILYATWAKRRAGATALVSTVGW